MKLNFQRLNEGGNGVEIKKLEFESFWGETGEREWG